MECTVHLLAGMPVCYIYRQQEGLTERTPAWATSRRLTDEVRSSLHSRSASHDYYGFLDYKEDRYTTVYGYMD